MIDSVTCYNNYFTCSQVEINVLVYAYNSSNPGSLYIERCRRQICIFESDSSRHSLDDILPLDKIGTYLHPDQHSGESPPLHTTGLNPSAKLALSFGIVIKPLS